MKIYHSADTQPSPSHAKGFTLIELLISTTITIIIVGVLATMTGVAVDALKVTQNATRSSRIAQDVITTLSKDLEGIVVKADNNYEWVRVDDSQISETQLGPTDSGGQPMPNKQLTNPLAISFFTSATDRYDGNIGDPVTDKGGDISFVQYKLVYQDAISASSGLADLKPVFSLYRRRFDPQDTFDKYLSQAALPRPPAIVDGDYLLAENIYDITVSFNFEKTVNNITTFRRIPIQINGGEVNSLTMTGEAITVTEGLSRETLQGYTLVSTDISILVISDAGMDGFKRAKINTPEELAEYLKLHGKHYSKSVIVPNLRL